MGMDFDTLQLQKVAEPIIRSAPFSRLYKVTFLGILSPRFRDLRGFPISYGRNVSGESDETRGHHSACVASLMGKLASKLMLPKRAIDYAVAWGLLHDIATWPLSHTGEASFSNSTETDSRDLRSMMIFGSHRIPNSLSLYHIIKSMSLDHEIMVELFNKKATGFGPDLEAVHKIIHSTLTPDALEGMHRSGRVFDVYVPCPHEFLKTIERDLISGIRVREDGSDLVFKFWRGKAKIYSDYINTYKSIEFESMWSRAIQEAFAKLSLKETLELSEAEIVRRIAGAAVVRGKDVQRYKDPLCYVIADDYKRRRKFDKSVPIEALSNIFIKNKI